MAYSEERKYRGERIFERRAISQHQETFSRVSSLHHKLLFFHPSRAMSVPSCTNVQISRLPTEIPSFLSRRCPFSFLPVSLFVLSKLGRPKSGLSSFHLLGQPSLRGPKEKRTSGGEGAQLEIGYVTVFLFWRINFRHRGEKEKKCATIPLSTFLFL